MVRFGRLGWSQSAATLCLLSGLCTTLVCGGQVPLKGSSSRRAPTSSSTRSANTDETKAEETKAEAIKAEATKAEEAIVPVFPAETVVIPGPLRSFLRMAGISQKALPSEVLPLLAQRIFQTGFQGGRQTEHLILLGRYVKQARELQALAGAKNLIRIENCSQTGPLLEILGYRLRQGCGGPDTVLETANPEKAFLTIDSGFPITDLEEKLGKGQPFTYAYAPSRVPVLFRESEWLKLGADRRLRYSTFVDILLNDSATARLYFALSNINAETRRYLESSIGLRSLLPAGPLLDFYGSQISIRSGHVLVPGGADAEAGWKSLVGANPQSASAFVTRLLSKDDGWLANYFDVLSRVDAAQQQHLTQTPRLQRYYEAFRSAETKGKGAGLGVFRRAPELLVLDTRLSWDANGDPHIPGSLALWKQLIQRRESANIFVNWKKGVTSLHNPDQLIEALTASSRSESEASPVRLYLMLCELDRRRAAADPLSSETILRLADRFRDLSNWYLIFSEFPSLDDKSIVHFLDVADGIEHIRSQTLKANTLGAFEADLGLWQILARQHQIPEAELNASWTATIGPFENIATSTQLFDSSYRSFMQVLHASGGDPNGSASEIISHLAGPRQQSPEGRRVHDRLAARMRAVLEDQQLVSLDTLFALGDGLSKLGQGRGAQQANLLAQASELRGFELPRAIFTNSEKISWAPAVYTSHHVELQVQTDLTRVIKGPSTHAQLEAARGQLAPFLRDTLVGLNYAYYEPPGAQILHANPLFVRAHDFLSVTITGSDRIWQPPVLVGAGIAAGGGAYLMGSLINLPYALATAEQDFIIPENIQALTWKELVPVLMTGAMLPRWWNVTPTEMHAAALYQRSGEELLRASVKDTPTRSRAMGILSGRVSSQRLEEIKEALSQDAGLAVLLPRLMATETFYLGEEYLKHFPDQEAASGPFGAELAELARRSPAEVNGVAVSHLFGTPHPTLAQTTSLEILNVSPFPFSGGETSRLFGESMESSNLYWARLADEMGYSPTMLNMLVPELTRIMAGKIFATSLEDYPAVLRAMQETAEDLRQGKITSLRKTTDLPTQAQAVEVR